MRTILLIMTAAAALAGCQATDSSHLGGGAGAVAGGDAGTVLGAFAGREIGAALDAVDQSLAGQAAQRAYGAPVGERITWRNPQSGNSGTIVPLRDGYIPTGAFCREFQQILSVGNQTEQAFSTACRQPNGAWKITG